MWWIIVTAILVVIVLILIIIWFKGSGESLFGALGEKTKGLKDCDGDGVPDLFDKCDCDPKIQEDLPKDKKCDTECGDSPTCVKQT